MRSVVLCVANRCLTRLTRQYGRRLEYERRTHRQSGRPAFHLRCLARHPPERVPLVGDQRRVHLVRAARGRPPLRERQPAYHLSIKIRVPACAASVTNAEKCAFAFDQLTVLTTTPAPKLICDLVRRPPPRPKATRRGRPGCATPRCRLLPARGRWRPSPTAASGAC